MSIVATSWRGSATGLLGVAVAVVAVMPETSRAQAGNPTVVIDHVKRTATYNGRVVKKGDRVPVKAPYTLDIVVRNSNSAVFDCDLAVEERTAAELEATFVFTKGLGPYLGELGGKVFANLSTLTYPGIDTLWPDTARKVPVSPISADSGIVDIALSAIDAALFAQRGLRPIYARTLAELERMRSLNPGADFALSTYRELVRSECITDSASQCARLRSTSAIVIALTALAARHSEFADAVAKLPTLRDSASQVEKTRRETLHRLADQGRKALADSEDLLAFAYGTEKLVKRTYSASPEIKCEAVKFSWNSARDVTVNVAPTAVAPLARTAVRDAYNTKLTATPDWILRPAVGLSFMNVPDAKFPKFGTKKIDDTTFTIKTAGSTTGQYTYGLTMAITWRGIDQRTRKIPFAFYAPDLTVNPSADLRAVAVGIGASIWNVKIGYGRAWTKHGVLADGQALNSTLRDPDELSTRDGYGRGQKYWSISIVGVPPFVP